MEGDRIEAVGKTLGREEIGEVQEGVVGGLDGDASRHRLACQPAMAIEVYLQAKRCRIGTGT